MFGWISDAVSVGSNIFGSLFGSGDSGDSKFSVGNLIGAGASAYAAIKGDDNRQPIRRMATKPAKNTQTAQATANPTAKTSEYDKWLKEYQSFYRQMAQYKGIV